MTQPVDVAEIANRIASYGVPGFSAPEGRQYPRIAEGISIPPSVLQDYYGAVSELHRFNKANATTYSGKTFERNVIAFIAPYVLADKKIDKSDVSAFLRKMAERPIIDYDIFRPIYHIVKNPETGPLKLGCFALYDMKVDEKALAKAINGRLKPEFLEQQGPYLIQTTVKARDEVIATRHADALFEQFENAVRFMVGPESKYDLRIFNAGSLEDKRAIVLNSSAGSISSESPPRIHDLDIESFYFLSPEVGFERVWKHLGDESNSKLMRKILLSIDWVGQSIAEKVSASAFIKGAIALEVLFTPEKGTFAPSIVSQLVESVALLIGTDADSRYDWDDEVKRLYGIRSNVAHAGKTDVDRDDVLAIQDLARAVIMRLLTTPSVQACAESEDLTKVLKRLKYSCPAL